MAPRVQAPGRLTVGRVLGQRFYARPTLDVARRLIGCSLVFDSGRGRRSGRIVETEAYVGQTDRACHASRGRTPRTEVMFGPPGHAYVFLVYGMHHCLNVVTEAEGFPAAVLIRAVEPRAGIAEENASGPGRLCRVLGIDLDLNRTDVTGPPLWIEARSGRAPRVTTTPRVGVDYAGSWAGKPWRFLDADSPAVSRPRESIG